MLALRNICECNPFMKFVRVTTILSLTFLLLTLTACMDITGRGPAPLSSTLDATEDTHPRAGHVYCMRGWLGIFSTGIDDLAVKINREVPTVSVADEEWGRLKNFLIREHRSGRLREPIILVGHSWGADDQIRVAQELADHDIKVDLLVTIDPVTPPIVPPNVNRVLNIYKSHPATDGVPFWRGVAIDTTATTVPIENIDLRQANLGFSTELIDHINIEKSPDVHQMVLQEIRKICPLRQEGMAGLSKRPSNRETKLLTDN